MIKEENYKELFVDAKKYLLKFVDEDTLIRHLTLGETKTVGTVQKLFRNMLGSMANRRGMGNAIGDLDKLNELLSEFNPIEVYDTYGNDWETLFKVIKKNYSAPTNMDIDNEKSVWVHYCKGIISGAKFLSRFSSIQEYNDFVQLFYTNKYTRAALPMLLAQEVHGLGFALACDFLKENGYLEYVKPDVHIKDLFTGLGISYSRSDYQVFKDVLRFSEVVDEVPYVVDKLFWLIGSGRFYLNKMKVKTDKFDFIEKMNKKYFT